MKKIRFEDFFDYLMIVLGSALAAFALKCVLIPNSILDGGVNGISIIINILTKFKLSILIIGINIPFIYIGYKNLGFSFLIKTIFSIISLSIFVDVFDHLDYVLTNNHLLATVYGSLILGLGVGLVIKNGGCLDGTESLGIVISKKLNISVGQFVLFCNAIIFTVAGFFFGIDRALYSLLAYFITSRIVDMVSLELAKAKAAVIVCNNGKDIANKIYEQIGRTCTMIDGSGLISGKKEVLYCVLTRMEIFELKRIVLLEENKAFITILDVSEIIGNHIKLNKSDV